MSSGTSSGTSSGDQFSNAAHRPSRFTARYTASGQPVAPVSQKRLALFEKGFSILCWMFFCNGLPTLTGIDDPSGFMKMLRYGILLVALLLLLARWKRSLNALSKGSLLWVMMAMVIGSVAWSISPSFSIDSIRGEILPMTFFALYFASRFNMREQMQILAITLGIGAAASLFYAMAVPSVGRHVGDEFDGAWKGIYAQKNNFSTTMTLTMLLFLTLSIVNKNPRERLFATIGLLGSVGMIILSTSKSGLIVFIVMAIVVLLSRLFRWKGVRSILVLDVGGMGLLALGAVLSVTWQAIVIGLGKDPTLSARTYIWTGALDKVSQEPLLGYGRAAFWHPDSAPAMEVGALAAKGFVPSHAHNGFIDVMLEIGLIGFAVFLLGLILSYGVALRRAYRAAEPEDLWPFAFFTLMVISNMTETVLITRTSVYWVLYMVLFLSLRIWPRRTGRDNEGDGLLPPPARNSIQAARVRLGH
jgi:exopolysaccharide production protein ExoQ